MAKRTKKDKDDVLAYCFVALAAFSENSVGPTQEKWARERAENCLWALGIEKFKTDRRTYEGKKLEVVRDTIDLSATKFLNDI